MNQIIVTSLKKNHKKIFYEIQLIISIVFVVALVFYLHYNKKNKEDLEILSSKLNQNSKVSSIYNVEKTSAENSIYLGKIVISKISVEYMVFNSFSEELLKISPCKFYGVNIGENGNICIAGHNYNTTSFFGRLNELELNDEIKLIDLENNEYNYIVYEMFETDKDDISGVVENKKDYELTLLTCNNTNKKRIIVKAFLDR